MQHLTVLTSKRNSLFDAKNRFHWTMNGVGLEFNHLFGFGVLDAGSMVTLAKQWRTVPARYHCEAGEFSQLRFEPSPKFLVIPFPSFGLMQSISFPQINRQIPSENSLILKITTNACKGSETEVNYLEHVQAVITVNSTRRGDIEMFLTSPMQTRSMILSKRINDDDYRDGFTKWPFMTTHAWGEYPQGTWTLEVSAHCNAIQRAVKYHGN